MSELLIDALTDALIDSARMLPLLFVVYVLIEVFEIRWGSKAGHLMSRAGAAGPAIGAVAGILPQCGVSVVGTALYSQRLITVGTLFAVYISTSDEAIPVILSQPNALPVLLPLLAVKLVSAIVVGYVLDLVFRRHNEKILSHAEAYAEGHDEQGHDHSHAWEEQGCCGHETTPHDNALTPKAVLWHPLIHTLKIFVWLFLISLALNLLFALVGQEAIAQALSAVPLLQPVLAALVGLIPNCAASVAITELYLQGVISFGATVAGLTAGGGLGLLVLVREDSNGDAYRIIAGLLAVSVALGMLISVVMSVCG